MKRCYQWNEFAIEVNAEAETFFGLIEKYTSFRPGTKAVGRMFRLDIRDQMEMKPPKDANFLGDGRMQLEEVREFCRYQRGGESWRIYKGYGAYHLDLGKRKLVVERNAAAILFDYYSILILVLMPLMELLKEEGFYRFHAGCAEIGGQVFLLAAESGGGKSTAIFALLEKGHAVLSDEMPLISLKDGQCNARALSDTIKVRQDAKLRFFQSFLDQKNLEQWKEDWYLRLRDVQDRNIDLSNPVRTLFVLKKTGFQVTEIRPIHPTRAVPALFPVTINTAREEESRRDFTFVMDFLNHAACYEIAFGTDMDLFVQAMEDFFNDQANQTKD